MRSFFRCFRNTPDNDTVDPNVDFSLYPEVSADTPHQNVIEEGMPFVADVADTSSVLVFFEPTEPMNSLEECKESSPRGRPAVDAPAFKDLLRLQSKNKVASTRPSSLQKSAAKAAPAKAEAKANPAEADAGLQTKTKELKKVSYLQRHREQKAQFEKDKEKNMKLTEDIMAGKYKKQGGGQPGGNMLITMPAPVDRLNNRKILMGHYRALYGKINKNNGYDNCPSATGQIATTQYSTAETQALKIEGGHRPLPRPDNVELPEDFRKPVGTLTLGQMASYDCKSKRMLCSVYGDIFDVSDRPDKYSEDSPYSWMTGHDITWGFVSGRDVPETVDQCYDLWKVAPEHFRDSKHKLIYAWVCFYEFEYGDAVGKLDLYENEAGLKGPPMEESEDCCIM